MAAPAAWLMLLSNLAEREGLHICHREYFAREMSFFVLKMSPLRSHYLQDA